MIHRMERSEHTDALTGEQSVIWTCPICGRREREQDGRFTTLDYGDAPTPEDAERFAEMAETPAGRLELSAILRRYPRHSRFYVDQGWLMQMADDAGVEGIGPPVRLRIEGGLTRQTY